MHWTVETPRAEGWFWRIQAWDGAPIGMGARAEMCHVCSINGAWCVKDEDQLLYPNDDDRRYDPIERARGSYGASVQHLWCGPIPEPTMPTAAGGE